MAVTANRAVPGWMLSSTFQDDTPTLTVQERRRNKPVAKGVPGSGDNEFPPIVRIVGVPVFAGRRVEAIRWIVNQALAPTSTAPVCISATSAHGVVEAQRDPELLRLLSHFAFNLPDGMPLVWVGRLKGAHGMERCYGPGIFEDVMRMTATLPIRHYFCGGKPGVAEKLTTAVKEKFGNANVVGRFSPPFRPMTPDELADLARDIDASGAAIVWVGISTPKQERLAAEIAARVRNARLVITVGAAFDFHIGAVRRAPTWMQRIGMEWAFRLAVEPRRLWKRYMVVVPGFIWYNLREFLFRPGEWGSGLTTTSQVTAQSTKKQHD